MNFFKRFTSFATNSWREFNEVYETNVSMNGHDQSKDSFENDDKKIEDNFVIQRKSFASLLLKKRDKKKKTVCVVDPRSPTQDFLRTPITAEVSTYSNILSPFNVNDMLDAVDVAIECTEGMNLSETELLIKDGDEKKESEINENNACEIPHWEKIEFIEKPLTESLIVETSSNELENTIEFKKEILDKNDKSCKIIGYNFKTVDRMNENPAFSSTPKKGNCKQSKIKPSRTPLMSIGNSPCIKQNKQLAKEINLKSEVELKKRNKKRQFPKSPIRGQRFATKTLVKVDQENF